MGGSWASLQPRQLGGFPGCSRPRRGPLFHQATPTSTAAALPSSRIQLQDPTSNTTRRAGSWMLTASARAALPLGDTHQAGGCCRFHLPGLGGAAALFLDAGANTTRPRRGPLFYQATTTSTAAALPSSRIQPGQQGCSRSHSYRATSWARFLGILAASAGPTAGTHEAAGLGILIAAARCSSIRRHTPAPPRLQDPTRATPTRRAAVPGHPCSLDSWAGSWMLAPTQPAGQQLGGFPG